MRRSASIHRLVLKVIGKAAGTADVSVSPLVDMDTYD